MHQKYVLYVSFMSFGVCGCSSRFIDPVLNLVIEHHTNCIVNSHVDLHGNDEV